MPELRTYRLYFDDSSQSQIKAFDAKDAVEWGRFHGRSVVGFEPVPDEPDLDFTAFRSMPTDRQIYEALRWACKSAGQNWFMVNSLKLRAVALVAPNLSEETMAEIVEFIRGKQEPAL